MLEFLKSRKKFFVSGMLFFSAGAIAGFLANKAISPTLNPTVIRQYSDKYPLTNPILMVEIGDKNNFPQFKPLEKIIDNYIFSAENAGDAKSVSVYFRDLNSSKWTGINENEQYMPSSMMKVAVLIAYLKLSESDQKILDHNIYYEEKNDPGQHYKPKRVLHTGSHSVRELLESMIVDSDNTAALILINLHYDAVRQVYADLSIPIPPEQLTDFMSAKTYSSLFRTLYSATYLTQANSERALDLLSKTDFTNGLRAGVPASTTVAQKFGEHTLVDAAGLLIIHELHDCGIVYYPKKPYLLCVMTKGNDFSRLEKVITKISQLTYQEAGSLNDD